MFTGEKDPYQLTKSLACMKLSFIAHLSFPELMASPNACYSSRVFDKTSKPCPLQPLVFTIHQGDTPVPVIPG
jgi:hypothetical protein